MRGVLYVYICMTISGLFNINQGFFPISLSMVEAVRLGRFQGMLINKFLAIYEPSDPMLMKGVFPSFVFRGSTLRQVKLVSGSCTYARV